LLLGRATQQAEYRDSTGPVAGDSGRRHRARERQDVDPRGNTRAIECVVT